MKLTIATEGRAWGILDERGVWVTGTLAKELVRIYGDDLETNSLFDKWVELGCDSIVFDDWLNSSKK